MEEAVILVATFENWGDGGAYMNYVKAERVKCEASNF